MVNGRLVYPPHNKFSKPIISSVHLLPLNYIFCSKIANLSPMPIFSSPTPPDYSDMSGQLFNPPTHNPADDFSSSVNQINQSFNWAIAGGIVTSILGLVALVIIVFVVMNCLKGTMDSVASQYSTYKGVALQAKSPASSDIEMGTMEKILDDIIKEKPIRFSPQQLEEFTKNYSTKLGSGGFGVVYKGELPNGTQIAIKVLNESLNNRVEEQFLSEVGTIGRTYHINLVRLYGFCFDPSMKALVYEYMENGSLDRFLFDKKSKIEWAKLHDIAMGTAKGIAYLHEECRQRIIHYDIKPANVLLDGQFQPKVADFGLAKLLNSGNTRMTVSRMRGTPGYAAPELWQPFPVTSKCDVYSFGMLLFEILGRRRNLELSRTESQEWFPRWVWEKHEKGELGEMMRLCEIEEDEREKGERMALVALWCVQHQPEGRPKMSTVVKMLEGVVEIGAPANPFQHLIASGAGVGGSGWTDDSSEDSASGARAEAKSAPTFNNIADRNGSSARLFHRTLSV